jgi:alkylation response protein AidB-like acyl-CoA dehydrogenase
MQPKTEARRRLLSTIEPLLPGFAERAAETDRTGAFFYENFEALRSTGYFAAPLPEEIGGGGHGLADMVHAQRAIAKADGSTAYAVGMHLMTAGQEARALAWPPALRARVFAAIVADGATVNSIVTEPELGSIQGGGRPASTFTEKPRAGSDTQRWRLNGHKTFSTLAPVLSYFLVAASFDDGSGDIGRAIVPRDRGGIRVDETWDALGLRATGSHDVYFDDVAVSQDDFLVRHPSGQGGQKDHDSAWFPLLVSAVSLGIAEAARDYAVDFARTRQPTGQAAPIAQLPYIRHEVGRVDTDLITARALLFTTAETWDAEPQTRGALLTSRVAATKLRVTDLAVEVVDRCMRIVGGVSFQRSQPLERYYRDVRGPLANPPITPRGLEMIARAALDGES